MVKIKQKKTMNLPQLIEWAWDNDAINKAFYSNCDGGSVYFDGDGDVYVEHEIAKTDTFTVEVEEEITEDTVIPRLITRNTHGGYNEWTNESVNGFNLTHVEAIYIPNDDLTLTLIWTKDKGLVE